MGSDLRGEVSIGKDRKRGGQTDRNSIFKATSKRPDSDCSSAIPRNDTGAFGPGLETWMWPRGRADLEMGDGRRDMLPPVAKQGNST